MISLHLQVEVLLLYEMEGVESLEHGQQKETIPFTLEQ